jgi:hypothetical protein
MRKTFPGYYRPTEEEFYVLWNACLFVLDANVLLNLYRYSQETSDELIGILKQISDRLWVPHQAALEYQQQRLQVITQQLEAYDEMQDLLGKTKKQLNDKLHALRRHPYINADYLSKRIQKAFAVIEKDLNRLKREHPDLLQRDSLRDALSILLEGKVGPLYSTERLDEIYKTGKQRYEREIPPGYKDTGKEGVRKYGDLILWFQVIDKAKETKKPIILVTDDRKDDWWLRFKGQTIGPRPELVDEMLSEAGVSFYLYQADPFMEHAQTFLERQVKQKAIDEVREIRQRDEEYIRAIQEVTIPSIRLPDETLRAMQEIASIRFPDETSKAMRETAAAIASVRLPDETLKAIREITSIRLPDETLRAMREVQAALVAIRLTDETLRAMREAQTALATIHFPDETLRAMREIASIRLSDETLEAMRETQEAIAAIRLPSETLRAMQAMTSFYRPPKQDTEGTKGSDGSPDSEPEETDAKDNQQET